MLLVSLCCLGRCKVGFLVILVFGWNFLVGNFLKFCVLAFWLI